MSSLELRSAARAGWKFDNTYARLPQVFYTKVLPTKVSAPAVVILNEPLAKSLGLDPEKLNGADAADIFSGNTLPEGGEALAQVYAGHQFGHFAILGDGRAHLLGEQIDPHGQRFDIQLKGSGTTPYSRRGDGRAALGPMLREYLISEAMHSLNIPTTRSLAVVTTGETVFRETPLEGAILTRVASSHLRVGSFQYFLAQNDLASLRILADYAIERHYPEFLGSKTKYIDFFEQVCFRQANLISRWMQLGFVHGVMNTDNMTISGESIDFGPCAFMNEFDPSIVFSSIDRHGRYAFGDQANIAKWNLARLGECILPLLAPMNQESAISAVDERLSKFDIYFEENWTRGMGAKLGLDSASKVDRDWISCLLFWMRDRKLDYTSTLRALSVDADIEKKWPDDEVFCAWFLEWQSRLALDNKSFAQAQLKMSAINPAIVPRNHRVEEALQNASQNKDFDKFYRLLAAVQKPFEETVANEIYCQPPPPGSAPYKTFCGT